MQRDDSYFSDKQFLDPKEMVKNGKKFDASLVAFVRKNFVTKLGEIDKVFRSNFLVNSDFPSACRVVQLEGGGLLMFCGSMDLLYRITWKGMPTETIKLNTMRSLNQDWKATFNVQSEVKR
jgi:hypothetical protein